MVRYTHLIKENVAPPGTKQIGVYQDGVRIGKVPLGTLRIPEDRGEKLYAFGLISDIHIGDADPADQDAAENFASAMEYLGQREDVEFICICGDLVYFAFSRGEAAYEDWSILKSIIDEKANGKPVRICLGNHEKFEQTRSSLNEQFGQAAAVRMMFSTFEHQDDCFVMIGCYRYVDDRNVVTEQMITNIQNALDDSQGRRCFIFHHMQPCSELMEAGTVGTDPYVPYGMFRQDNVMLFHGHTHEPFKKQEVIERANYNTDFGFRSVHIPALHDSNEGYVVEVYEKGIYLQGMNFGTGAVIPIGCYWIDMKKEG